MDGRVSERMVQTADRDSREDVMDESTRGISQPQQADESE